MQKGQERSGAGWLTSALQYTGKEVPEMENMMDERVLDLANLMRRIGVDEGRPVDFGRIAQYFTLDSLTHIGMLSCVNYSCSAWDRD